MDVQNYRADYYDQNFDCNIESGQENDFAQIAKSVIFGSYKFENVCEKRSNPARRILN